MLKFSTDLYLFYFPDTLNLHTRKNLDLTKRCFHYTRITLGSCYLGDCRKAVRSNVYTAPRDPSWGCDRADLHTGNKGEAMTTITATRKHTVSRTPQHIGSRFCVITYEV